MDSKTKTTLFGVLLIVGGAGCFILFILGLVINTVRIPSPSATTKGTVISRKELLSGKSRRADCAFAYKVEGETYTIISTCGANIPMFAETEGDEVEIIYQTTKPSNGAVNRQGFFNFLGVLGIPLIIFGWLLIRKAKRMSAGDMQSSSYYNEQDDRDFRRL